MSLSEWAGRKIVILGLARQGKALVRHLKRCGAQIVVSDRRNASELQNEIDDLTGLSFEPVFGGHPFGMLDGVETVFVSGGVPLDLPIVLEAQRRKIALSNDSQLFLENCPAPVIGLTGSSGKSTTSALVGEILNAARSQNGRRVWIGGNIGYPLLNDLDKVEPEDVVVMELSSFQLELMNKSPHIAAVLNITPNHLDRHKSMQAYTAAKERILSFQTDEDVAVLGRDDLRAWRLKDMVRGKLISFGMHEPEDTEGTFIHKNQIWLKKTGNITPVCSLEGTVLRGEHNRLNIAAASAIALAAGIDSNAIATGVNAFKGIEHRLEFVRNISGADWFNDSIATSPQRTIAALRSFDEPIILMVGGRDKNLSWDEFAQLAAERVDHLILFGEAAPVIANVLRGAPSGERPYSVDEVPGLEEAVAVAARIAEQGEIILLSPGATSYDQYHDFAERGEHFRKLVRGL
jgi:UDP-N-acetylmuramoylalanine--D-glutamate ligase